MDDSIVQVLVRRDAVRFLYRQGSVFSLDLLVEGSF
jgi:hypothetical protein